MGVGSMSGFYVGVSGLQVNHTALATTAHNLANMDSQGYSRQQILMRDVMYSTYAYAPVNSMQLGLGTDMAKIRQVRDTFADKQYRLESGRGAFYEAMSEVEQEVERYFGSDIDGQPLKNAMTTFFYSLNEIQKEPDSILKRETMILAAQQMIDQSRLIYDQIKEYQECLNEQIDKKVKEINQMALDIHELNKKIVAIEGNEVEEANDLRDQRNYLLDKLATYGEIRYREDKVGCVTVTLEGTSLVSEDRIFELGTQLIRPDSKLLTVVWADHGNMELYHYSDLPSASNCTDVGSLKGLLFARGTIVANYTNMSEESIDWASYTNRDGSQKYSSLEEFYHGERYSNYGEYYEKNVEPFLISNLQAQLDYLMHNIVTTINDILCPNTTTDAAMTVTDSNGIVVTIPAGTTVLDTAKAPIGLGEDGEPGVELFSRRSVERYTKYSYTDANGKQQNLYVYNEEDPKDIPTQYTIDELLINPDVIKNPSLIPLSNLDHSNAQIVANRLLDAWNCEADYANAIKTLTPNTLTGYDFQGYYTAMINDLANAGNSYQNIADNQRLVANQIDDRRQVVAGVSSDEELSNMIMFQQAYNAASRYINVVAEMLDTLVNRMGRG